METHNTIPPLDPFADWKLVQVPVHRPPAITILNVCAPQVRPGTDGKFRDEILVQCPSCRDLSLQVDGDFSDGSPLFNGFKPDPGELLKIHRAYCRNSETSCSFGLQVS